MNQHEKKEENNQLKEMNNEELKNRILDINEEQLSKIGAMSYYYFINRSVELIKLINKDRLLQKIKSQKEKEFLIKKFDYIIDCLKKIHRHRTEKEIDEEIKKLLDIREDLCNLSSAIDGYIIELSYIKELLDYHTMKIVSEKEYRNSKVSKNEINFLINNIGEILAQSTKEHFNFVNIVSNILSIMPFRISKTKYFDVIKSTITRNFNQYSVSLAESRIEEYKMLFDSSLNGNYGITFDDYFTSIQRFKNLHIENKALDELENITRDVLNLNLDINETGMIINNLGLLINRLIIIFTIKDRIKFNSSMEDVFSKWEKYRINMNKELLDSLIRLSDEELTKLEKQMLDDIKLFEVFNEEGLNRKDFFDKNLNEEMLFTKKILTYYNDIEFTKYNRLFPEKDWKIDNDYLEQLVNSLIQYINRSISTMNNLERKMRMRRLLSTLELPFVNIEEFISYIEYSLDERVVSKEEVLFTIDTVNHWLNGLKERQ